MFRKMILALALLAGVGVPAFIAPAAVAPALAQEEKADPLAGIDKQALEQVIRDYLLENPEIIVEALDLMEQRQQEAEAAHRRQMIAARQEALVDDPSSPIMGNPEGPVTVVEFFDYRCGYCRRMFPAIQNVIAEESDVRWVMKEFPILGPESVYASRAALAAEKQGKYVAFHNAMMSDGVSVTNDNVDRVAALIGMDVEQMKADMESEEINEILKANLTLARELGVSGTPSFVIGEVFVPGAIDETRLRQLIDQLRRTEG
jgi:protein-disulfide isomerase